MATLKQIRDRVARKLKDPDFTSLSASIVDDEINRAIRYYSNFRFWFNEDLSDITLTASAQVVPSIPSDNFMELKTNGLMLIDNQVKVTLQKLSPDDFFAMDYEQTGRPEYYTYRDYQYLLLPIPQEAYTLKFRYLKKYTALSSDSDTNDFTDNAEDLLMLHVIKNVYAEDKQDMELSAYYSNLEGMELNALRNRTDSRNGAGYLQAETIIGG